jgi:hypothetical protein
LPMPSVPSPVGISSAAAGGHEFVNAKPSRDGRNPC